MQGIVDALIGQNVIACIVESPGSSRKACTNDSLSFVSQATKGLFSGWKIGLQDFVEDGRLSRLFFCLPVLLADAKDDSAEVLRGFSLVDTYHKDAKNALTRCNCRIFPSEGFTF